MPPKSSNKKTAAATWYYCDTCCAHITASARETHEKVCPIQADDSELVDCIHDGVLYTSAVERRAFQIEEIKELPSKYVNNLVFISEGAMRLARFHIGQEVVITTTLRSDTIAPLVRSIWPVPEKFLSTIFVSDDDYALNWTPFKEKKIKIHCLPNSAAMPAKTLRLQLETESINQQLNVTQLKDATRLLKFELKQLIYTQGSRIQMNFFNKILNFKVLALESTQDSLEEVLHNLNLNSDSGHAFFRINATTEIHVECEQQLSSENINENEEPKHLITKTDIGGLDSQLQLVEETIEFALGFRSLPKGVKISRGLLLYGSSGCGKSMLCEAMCTTMRQKSAHIIRINTSELFSKFLGETERNLATHFESAYALYPRPTIIIIEDVHQLCPKHESNELVKRVAIAFLSMLDAFASRREAQRICILATTSQIDSLNPSIRRCGRFDCEVEIGAPSPQERAAILKCLLRNVAHELILERISELAQITHGFVGADLANLIYSASLHALKLGRSVLNSQDLDATLTHIKPSAMREVLIENPNVHWTDIGGQAELKLKLKQAIEWPLQHPDKFKRLGIKPPRGILMFGPPGCSKTMIAKALATESQLNFLAIKGPELFSMWVGESERAVREVFRKARQVAPAIVFFDEIDAIGGERSEAGAGSSVKERVLTQLLTELDGVEALQNVTIVAATNRPDMIDKALLRPGRIDRIIYVGLPDAEARHEIFRIKLREMPLADDVNVASLVQRTEGYSGAEIQAVCHEAALKTLEQSFDATQVTWQEFEYALNVVQPRTSADLLHLYEEYLKRS